jgi:CelD/BcsL family acetyltransferase involved in cellulose biosynthesis
MLRYAVLQPPDDPCNFFRDATIDAAAAPDISLAQLARAAGCAYGGSELLELPQIRQDATLLDLPEVRRLAELSPPAASSLFLPVHPALQPDHILSSQFRADHRNRLNRLRRFGPVQCKHAPADLPLDDATRIFTEIEASGWKGDSGTQTATTCSPHRLAFLHELAAGGDGLQVTVHVLFAADDPVAAIYGITIGATHLLLLMGYDERYARASPGHLLIHEVIRWSAACQLRELDFLSNAPHYQRWHPAGRPMHHILVCDGSLKGRLVYHAKRLRYRLRFDQR